MPNHVSLSSKLYYFFCFKKEVSGVKKRRTKVLQMTSATVALHDLGYGVLSPIYHGKAKKCDFVILSLF